MRAISFLIFLSLASWSSLLVQQSLTPRFESFSGRIVVFFYPSQAEYDSLARDENSGIDEVLGDFQFYAGQVQSFLKDHQIASTMTEADVIEIEWSKKTFRFERCIGEHIVGMILSDGVHLPKVVFGVDTDDGLQQVFAEYFKTKEKDKLAWCCLLAESGTDSV